MQWIMAIARATTVSDGFATREEETTKKGKKGGVMRMVTWEQIITRTPLSISQGRIPWTTTPEACTHEMMATRANATIAWFTCLQCGTRFPRTVAEALDRKSLPKMT